MTTTRTINYQRKVRFHYPSNMYLEGWVDNQPQMTPDITKAYLGPLFNGSMPKDLACHIERDRDWTSIEVEVSDTREIGI